MKRHRIYLVPVDFSRQSEAALDRAIELAKRDKANILVMHVLSAALTFSPDRTLSELFASLAKAGRTGMARLARRNHLKPEQLLMVRGANAGDAIAATAKKRRAAMIVMASHGKTGFERLALGSVAERTVRTAACPVLILKGRRNNKAKTLVVPYDFSRGGDIALRTAVRMRQADGNPLVLLNIVPPVVSMTVVGGAISGEIQSIAKHFHLKSEDYRVLVLERPQVGRAIAQTAKKLKAAMIIMGSHGRSGFQRLLLGSVAEKTLRYAECPVLIVKY